MTAAIESVTSSAIALALDAASLRQQAIAANIANHASEAYVPQQVDFASQLEEARRSIEARGTLDASSLVGVRPQLEPVLDAQGLPAKVRLDEQMVDLAQNSVQYQALARGLSRHFAILSSAINDGKR